MPDISGLYPAPPQQPQNALASDPGRLIQMLQGIQTLKLQGQQFPALAQQPAAALQGQNIANTAGLMQQQAEARRLVSGEFGTAIAGMKNPTADDVHNLTAYISRSHPEIATRYPDIINAAADVALNHPKGVKYGGGLLMNMGMTPGEASSLVTAPPNPTTGAQRQEPITSSNLRGAERDTGLPPGSDVSAQAMQGDLARSGTFASDIYPLHQSLDLAKKLGPGGMAPGSKGRQEFESFIYGLAPQLVPQGMQDKIKTYAELEKYLVNNASQRANNLGPHTNDGLAAAVTGSPNVHINDLAGIDLIKAQIALRRMEHSQTLQAAQSGPVNYTANKAKFAAGQDARAYAIDMMTPEQITKLDKSLKGPERAKFNASLKAARDSGVVTMPEANATQ